MSKRGDQEDFQLKAHEKMSENDTQSGLRTERVHENACVERLTKTKY